MNVSPIIIGTQTFVPIVEKTHGGSTKYINVDQIADLRVKPNGEVKYRDKKPSPSDGDVIETVAMNFDYLSELSKSSGRQLSRYI